MNKKWLIIYVAALFEVSWVTGLKYADGALAWSGTVAAIIVSFYLLIKASSILPISTVYAVFTGLGAAGTVLVEILLFSSTFSWTKILLCAVLISGVIGLKLVTGERDLTKGEV